MSLILNALAFLPQVRLAKFTGSTKKCFKCELPCGVRGLPGVAFPCGHIFGECKCLVIKAEAGLDRGKKRTTVSLGNPSSQLECPYCGVSAVDQGQDGKNEHRVVAALHAAEALLSHEKKAELLRQLDLLGPGHGCTWEKEGDASGGAETADQNLEMDFNDIIEYGT